MENLTSLEKYRIIEPILQNRATVASVSKHNAIPVRTINHWKSIFEKNGINAFERKKQVKKENHRIFSNSIQELVQALALHKPPMTVKNIHRRVGIHCKKENLPEPSYHWVYKQTKNIPISLITLAQKGSKAYKQKYEFLFRQESGVPNSIWQADHTELDIWLLSEKGEYIRPWLTVVLDDFSRAICGFYLSIKTPDATHTALALRQAIWAKKLTNWKICGIPQKLYTDNGGDFISDHIEQVCLKLKIQLIHSLPGNPRGRGKIERFFLTVNKGLLEILPGFSIGGRPSSTPSLTLSQFENKLQEFIIDEYNHTPREKEKLSPYQKWASNDSFLPQLPNSIDELDDLMMKVDKLRRVQRDGIHFMGLRYVAITLISFVGESILIRFDPRDLAEIKVYYEDGEFICRAICQEIADISINLRELLTARKALKKELDGKVKDSMQLLKTMVDSNQNKPHLKQEKEVKTKSTFKLYQYE